MGNTKNKNNANYNVVKNLYVGTSVKKIQYVAFYILFMRTEIRQALDISI